MTCIVALEHEGSVWMGGDSAASRDNDVVRRSNEKVFFNENFLIGYSGSFRIGQLLQYALHIPKQSYGQTDMEYMVVDFVDALRNLMRDKGTLMKEEEGEAHDSEILIGYRGKIYVVESDFHVGNPIAPYAACGSGASYAMGAMYVLADDEKLSPQEKINKALSASAEYCVAVKQPFSIMGLPKQYDILHIR
jgi:ATP-dependent protease HslVU (ClpYQ) peptidase subunit